MYIKYINWGRAKKKGKKTHKNKNKTPRLEIAADLKQKRQRERNRQNILLLKERKWHVYLPGFATQAGTIKEEKKTQVKWLERNKKIIAKHAQTIPPSHCHRSSNCAHSS